jgi:hypothetical protein
MTQCTNWMGENERVKRQKKAAQTTVTASWMMTRYFVLCGDMLCACCGNVRHMAPVWVTYKCVCVCVCFVGLDVCVNECMLHSVNLNA